MIPAGHRCPETTHAFGAPVQCRKTAGHDGQHWALSAGGLDVVWLVNILRPKKPAGSSKDS